MTTASGHRLCVAGCWLDQDGFPMVLCPICINVIGVSLFLCANQRREAHFGGLFHVFVFVTCKIMFSKYMWNLVNSKCICA
jgi:hypothetical protein